MFMFHRAWRYGYATPCYSTHARGEPRAKAHVAYSWHTGPMFGVRRPMRYLAWKLDLSDEQSREIVAVLDRLKTAYSQSKLDRDRSLSQIADAFGGSTYDADGVDAALSARTDSARVLNTELGTALRRMFEILTESQRRDFAYLLRSGGFTL